VGGFIVLEDSAGSIFRVEVKIETALFCLALAIA